MCAFRIILPDDRPVYSAGDAVEGAIVRVPDCWPPHHHGQEMVTSVTILFLGTLTIPGELGGETIRRHTLFDQRLDLMAKESDVIDGTRTWPFRFTFPALSSAIPLINGVSSAMEGFGSGNAPHLLPPTIMGDFVSRNRYRCDFGIEYKLVAKLRRRGREKSGTLITHQSIIHSTSMLARSQTITILPPKRMIEPIYASIANKVKPTIYWFSERYRAWPAPRFWIARDPITCADKPLGIKLKLVDIDGDSWPTGAANIQLLQVKLVVVQTTTIKYGAVHKKDQEYNNTFKWPFKRSNMQATFSTEKPVDLSALMGMTFVLPGINPTINTPALKVSHTLTLKARVRSGNRVYKYELLHQGLKMSVPPVPEYRRPKPSPALLASTATLRGPVEEMSRVANCVHSRQDSVGLSLARRGRRRKHPGRVAQNGGASNEEQIHEDGIRRRDWAYT
ncbi:hypothetical protein NA57DRAFT_56150 [Rhizodiscina lignyota]|uniref:Uncharacterized protein n=1 Tax=Rhizodiscina lignyota TaxID=1504668 RepID=A0A9P4IF29_9PEZI|nr:hypothetical protein NA57DRAFT_56150 [Rhizodiscina lignyota]